MFLAPFFCFPHAQSCLTRYNAEQFAKGELYEFLNAQFERIGAELLSQNLIVLEST